MLKKFTPPMRQFMKWALVVIVVIALVSALLANKLIGERQSNTLAEVNARTALQAQGRATTMQEYIEGTLNLGNHITESELVRLFVTEVSLGKTKKTSALLTQQPYLNHALRELKERYKLAEVLILGKDAAPIAHAYTEPQELTLTPTQIMAHNIAVTSRTPRVLPLRTLGNQLVLDIVKPILNMEEDEKAAGAGSLMLSLPVSDKMAELLAPATLDRPGERVSLLQRTGETAIASVSNDGLNTLDLDEAQLVSRVEESGGQAVASPIDGVKAFARLLPVFNTPFFVLQEYKSANALELIALYKRALYGMIMLAAVALIALMLTLIGHLLAQRNRTRVKLLGQTMDALVRAVEIRDPYLAGHHMRTARLALKLGNIMGNSVDERATLFYAAQLSGVGKIFVPTEILTKKTKLTKPERKKLEAHVGHAEAVLKDVPFDLPILPVIQHMYEREDGSGYPNSLKAEGILPLAKTLAAADAFVAMTNPRSYRKAMTEKQAIKELEKSGQYDTASVDALKSTIKK